MRSSNYSNSNNEKPFNIKHSHLCIRDVFLFGINFVHMLSPTSPMTRRRRLRTVQMRAEGTSFSESMNEALCDFLYATP